MIMKKMYLQLQLRVFHWAEGRRFYFTFSILFVVAMLYRLLEARTDDPAFLRQLNHNPLGLKASVHHYEQDGRAMRYVEIGYDSLPLIVFVHGAPSSSAFWKSLLRDTQLLKRAKLLAVDRAGYGYSGYGIPEVSVERQAALIAPILRAKRKVHPAIILHGSSYGGTVTARLAMDYPDLIDGILLQSSSNKPESETTYWITHPTSHPWLRWLIPGSLRVANAEKLAHASQLRAMEAGWQRIKSAAIILHGLEDRLIFPDNARYAYTRMKNAAFLQWKMVKGSRHDLLFTQRPLLIRSLLTLLDVTAKKTSLAHSRHGQRND